MFRSFFLPSFLVRYCYWLQLFPSRFSPNNVDVVFVSYFFPCPTAPSFTNCIHVSFHSANIQHKYISILKLDTQKSFPFCCCWCCWCSTRYLNFILMFVPSINFYNPFINLIKTKHNRRRLASKAVCCCFHLSTLCGIRRNRNFYSFKRCFKMGFEPESIWFAGNLYLLALKLLSAYPTNVQWRRAVSSILVHVRQVILQVGLSCEAHRATVECALEDSLVRVLSQMFAQRLPTEELLANLTLDLLSRILIHRQSVQRFVEEKLGVWVGAVDDSWKL